MAVLSLTPSCCSIVHGSSQDVVISSYPAGAKVTINGEEKGVTPTAVKLSRDNDYVVQLTKEGYKPYAARLEQSLSGWVWGNVLFGGLIGIAVDGSTGNMYNITPENVHAQLTKEEK